MSDIRKLKKVYVEVTNICNLNCSFCPKTKREPKEMSEEFFDMVLQKIKPHTNYIYMHVMGEPLNHSKIDVLLDICEKNEIIANITTNGMLLPTVGKKIMLKSAIRQINISLHSFEGKNKAFFETYLKNIFSFIRETQKHRKIIFCLRLWNLNSDGEENINEMALDMLQKEFCAEKSLISKVTDRNGVKLEDGVYLQQEERFVWPKIGGESIFEKGRCFGLKTHIGILCDGTTVPCCIDNEGELSLGNIEENSLCEILESQKAQRIFEGFKHRIVVEDFCKTCGFRHNV